MGVIISDARRSITKVRQSGSSLRPDDLKLRWTVRNKVEFPGNVYFIRFPIDQLLRIWSGQGQEKKIRKRLGNMTKYTPAVWPSQNNVKPYFHLSSKKHDFTPSNSDVGVNNVQQKSSSRAVFNRDEWRLQKKQEKIDLLLNKMS